MELEGLFDEFLAQPIQALTEPDGQTDTKDPTNSTNRARSGDKEAGTSSSSVNVSSLVPTIGHVDTLDHLKKDELKERHAERERHLVSVLWP